MQVLSKRLQDIQKQIADLEQTKDLDQHKELFSKYNRLISEFNYIMYNASLIKTRAEKELQAFLNTNI